METTEKIAEAYCRYIKGWATIPNIKYHGQYEIDLLAVDPRTDKRYHIESGVSISGHKNIQKTMIYAQITVKRREEVYKRLEDSDGIVKI
jgi:hypothetical protein